MFFAKTRVGALLAGAVSQVEICSSFWLGVRNSGIALNRQNYPALFLVSGFGTFAWQAVVRPAALATLAGIRGPAHLIAV